MWRVTEVPSLEIISGSFKSRKEDKNFLRRVHATGTIIHTNLGRSLLSQKLKKILK